VDIELEDGPPEDRSLGGGDGIDHGDMFDSEMDFSEPEKPAPPKAEEKPAKPSAEDRKASDRVAALEKELDNVRRTAEHWHKEATSKRAEPEKPAAPKGREPEDVSKFIDDLSSKGVEALTARGLMTREDAVNAAREETARIVREELERERSVSRRDAAILAEYPDLANPKSALAMKTVEKLNELVDGDEEAAKTAPMLKAAARLAKLELDAEKGEGEGRERRLAAQGGNGRSSGAGERPSRDSHLAIEFGQRMGLSRERAQAALKRKW